MTGRRIFLAIVGPALALALVLLFGAPAHGAGVAQAASAPAVAVAPIRLAETNRDVNDLQQQLDEIIRKIAEAKQRDLLAPELRVEAPETVEAGDDAYHLTAPDPDGSGGVSIALADDETLHSLNERFRGFDEVTDVLSFKGESGGGGSDAPFPPAPDGGATIGEVVLSYPIAVRQADEHNVSTEQELALLVVHGVLHLLGHDHEEPGDEARMKQLERQALASFFGAKATAGGA